MKDPTEVTQTPTPSPASAARLRPRHIGLILSFVILVALPFAAATFYLLLVAKDQYASRLGFSVRQEEMSQPVELLGGITELSGGKTDDADMLFAYIRSQQMVRAVDARLDLRQIFRVEGDPWFSLGDDDRIEALTDQWARMVAVSFDSGKGLIEVTARAFTADDANAIADAVLLESTEMVNALSAAAREDATRFARAELDRAMAEVKAARTALTAYRSQTQIVDPEADIQGRMGLLNSLQAQLAGQLIELDILRLDADESDPRVARARNRVAVIEARIAEERERFGDAEGPDAAPYADVLGEYESLAVDLEFAQEAYLSARAAYDRAVAEASHSSRYLATYIPPTYAETAEFPRKGRMLTMLAGFLMIGWAVLAMVFYALRDRP